MSSAAVVLISRSPGTLRNRLLPSDSSVAQRIGNAAFFAPPTRMVPESCLLPRIRIASMTERPPLRCPLASRKAVQSGPGTVFDPVLFAQQLSLPRMACLRSTRFRRRPGLADRARPHSKVVGGLSTCRHAKIAALLFFVLAGTQKVAWAQVATFDIRRFSPPTDPQGSLALEPVTTPGHLAWAAGFIESYAHRLLVLKDASGRELAVPVRDQLSFDALFNVGIGERLALGLRIPTVMAQTGDAFPTSGWRVPRSALGDLGFDAKATLIPRGTLGGMGLAAVARMTVPTGNADSTVSTKGVTGELRLLGEIDWIVTALRASAGVMVRSERQVLLGDTYGQELPWAVGLVVKPRALGIDSQGRWQWFIESSGAVAVTPSFAFGRGSPASLGIASRYAFARDFSALAGIQLPLDSAVGVPSIRFVFGISWAPRFRDADGDGIPDDADDCPELAEDFNGVEDDDGCPEGNDAK